MNITIILVIFYYTPKKQLPKSFSATISRKKVPQQHLNNWHSRVENFADYRVDVPVEHVHITKSFSAHWQSCLSIGGSKRVFVQRWRIQLEQVQQGARVELLKRGCWRWVRLVQVSWLEVWFSSSPWWVCVRVWL